MLNKISEQGTISVNKETLIHHGAHCHPNPASFDTVLLNVNSGPEDDHRIQKRNEQLQKAIVTQKKRMPPVLRASEVAALAASLAEASRPTKRASCGTMTRVYTATTFHTILLQRPDSTLLSEYNPITTRVARL